MLPALLLGYLAFDKLVLTPDGSTELSWTAPTEDENSSPLDDLAGYDVHCWDGASQYTITIHVEDPATTKYVIDGLAPGTYLCAVAAIDADGRESALSNVVAKTVP